MMPGIIGKALRKRNEAGLARIIHEGFYFNRRYVAATSLTTGGLAARFACRLGGFVTDPRE
jgi:hypothetical protein